jgi:hypothetical protein
MAAGYSLRPLRDKLGIAPGDRVCLLGAPPGYREALALPPEVAVHDRLRGRYDFVQVFARSDAELRRRLPALRDALDPDGMLWLSWPKKASGVPTDLDDGAVRRAGLDAGLVDVKVCAVDETWSGLRFVFRKVERAALRAARESRRRGRG